MVMNLRIHKMLGNFLIAAEFKVPQEGLSSMSKQVKLQPRRAILFVPEHVL
jgi:hypothetical protein